LADPQDYLARAADLRAKAAAIADPIIRKCFRDLAAEYEALANGLAAWPAPQGLGAASDDARGDSSLLSC
jgi:hypothetical protein